MPASWHPFLAPVSWVAPVLHQLVPVAVAAGRDVGLRRDGGGGGRRRKRETRDGGRCVNWRVGAAWQAEAEQADAGQRQRDGGDDEAGGAIEWAAHHYNSLRLNEMDASVSMAAV